jgi:Insertion element 4 transposase N-terminal
MPLKLHDLPDNCKLPVEMQTQLLQDIYAPSLVQPLLDERIRELEQSKKLRTRKLTLLVILWMVIIMNWYPKRSQASVLTTMAAGARFLWPSDEIPLPTPQAIVYRREQVGIDPLQRLFRTACKPLASPETKGAFRLGYRIMALDGTWQNVPDTAANAAAFGRFQSGQSQSAFPQARVVILVECGTHAIVDADVVLARKDGGNKLGC